MMASDARCIKVRKYCMGGGGGGCLGRGLVVAGGNRLERMGGGAGWSLQINVQQEIVL
jgi:hypothetical protein